jgi:hypothetical protein
MLTVPAATPVTCPLVGPLLLIVAIAVLLELQLPPEGVPTSAAVGLPAQTELAPVIVGAALTATAAVVEEHPVVALVNVNVTLPAATPVTVFPLTDAFVGSLLTHVPPDAGVNVIVAPTQTLPAEVLTVGLAFTVTALVVFLQPVLV